MRTAPSQSVLEVHGVLRTMRPGARHWQGLLVDSAKGRFPAIPGSLRLQITESTPTPQSIAFAAAEGLPQLWEIVQEDADGCYAGVPRPSGGSNTSMPKVEGSAPNVSSHSFSKAGAM